MKNKIKTFTLLVLSLFLFNSCATDESQASEEVLFSAKINGELFEATKINQATLLQTSNLGQRFDINAENNKYKIFFAISHKNVNDCMPILDYENLDNDTEVLIDIYFKVDGTNNFVSSYFALEDNNGVTIENASIISCLDNVISGSFSGSFYNIHSPEDSDYPQNIEITEGKFNNIEFVLIDNSSN